MNPENNQPIMSGDYLNQIAPTAPKKMFSLQQKPVMIGVILLGVITLLTIITIIFGNMSGGTTSIRKLSARLSSTESTVIAATKNIKSSKLREVNVNLKIYLSNTIRDFTPILTSYKIDTKKLDKSIISAESNTEMLATLEDARLNNEYDLVYAREMSYKLETILSLMKQIYKSTSNSKMQKFLDSAYTNLEPTQKQFADFNTANN